MKVIYKIKISDQMESLNIANSVSIVCHHINRMIDNKKNWWKLWNKE